MFRLNSVAFRLLLAAAVVSLTAVAVGGWLLSNVFRGSVERQLDNRLLADMENLIAVAEPGPDGHLVGRFIGKPGQVDIRAGVCKPLTMRLGAVPAGKAAERGHAAEVSIEEPVEVHGENFQQGVGRGRLVGFGRIGQRIRPRARATVQRRPTGT